MTEQGLATLRAQLPYADLGELERDRRLERIDDLFTVALLSSYVTWKLGGRHQSDDMSADFNRPRTSQHRSRRPGSERRFVTKQGDTTMNGAKHYSKHSPMPGSTPVSPIRAHQRCNSFTKLG